MKKTRKIISLLLSILMIITSVPLMALNSFAASSGDYEYELLKDGTAQIKHYEGSETEIEIPSEIDGHRVTFIGSGAFKGCTSLTSVTIPDSITEIYPFVLDECASLRTINVAANNMNYSSENGILFNKDKTLLIRYPQKKDDKTYTIPDSVTEINSSAFSGCTLIENVIIPDSTTFVERDAFEECTSLISVVIGNGVTYLGDYAFDGCSSLESVTIGSGIEAFGYDPFADCNSIKTAKIDSNAAFSLFCGFDSLENVIIGENVTAIGDGGLFGCKSLKRVYIPDTVTTIGEHAFGYYMDYDTNKEVAIEGFTIVGKPGSAAQAYAEGNGFAVVCPESIKVSKLPDKTTYFIGDAFDPTGIVVSYVNNDGSEDAINAKFTITGFDSSVAGKNTITVAYDGMTTTFDVEIKAPSIALSESSLAFDLIGKIATLTATAVPSDSEIVWKSSNESVATVENGVVTAKGAGNATITATITVNGIEYSAECAVDVKLPTMSFPDVRMGDWYSDAVKYNFERGYITGYSNGTFGPSNNIQRQDFVLVLARIAGANLSAYKGQNGGFSDVPSNAYYSAAVAWAKDKGIVTGYSADNFGVGTYITREQISLILCRYLGGEASGDVDTILNAYSDGGNTSPWAKAGVAWAVKNGIIGNSDYLNPNGNAGRAEVAQIIYNMSNKGML